MEHVQLLLHNIDFIELFIHSLTNLNQGGVITGAPKSPVSSRKPLMQTTPSENTPMQPKTTPTPTRPLPESPLNWKMEALYDCKGEEEGELSFSKGETLLAKDKIGQEWYVCQRDNETGIVPANYVRRINN